LHPSEQTSRFYQIHPHTSICGSSVVVFYFVCIIYVSTELKWHMPSPGNIVDVDEPDSDIEVESRKEPKSMLLPVTASDINDVFFKWESGYPVGAELPHCMVKEQPISLTEMHNEMSAISRNVSDLSDMIAALEAAVAKTKT
jgi:hypothetical protein